MSRLTALIAIVFSIALSACASLSSPSLVQTQEPGTLKRIFVDGTYGQVHVRVAKPVNGAQEKTPLVLFHPTPYSSQTYLPFIEEMRADRLVIAMDTPGYGDSDRPDTPPSMTEYAENALKVLESLGVSEPVDAIGYHTGTLIATEMALKNPLRVRKMVLAGVPVYPTQRLPELYKKYAQPIILKKDGSHLTSKWTFATQTMEGGLRLEEAQAHFNDYMQSMPHSTQAYYTVFSYPGYDRLPNLRTPTLFVSINGSLKDETRQAHELTPGSDWLYMNEITTGLFDVAHKSMARAARDYLDK